MNKTKDITKKGWFYLLLIVAQMFLLPYASRNFSMEKMSQIISLTLSHAIVNSYLRNFFIIFQTVSSVFILLTIIYKNKLIRVFNIYACISYFIFAVVQNIAFTGQYGMSIVTVNLVMFAMVGAFWVREIFQQQNQLTFTNLKWNTLWMIPLALIAYWMPVNADGSFAFNFNSFFTNGSSLAFCCMTPVFLTVLTYNLPHVNIATYRVTSFIGIVIGLYNMMNFLNPERVNVAILHLPLLIISVYSFIISFLKNVTNKNDR